MRVASVLALVLAALLAAAAPAPASTAAARLVDCVAALEAGERRATFAASADAVPDSRRIALRFTLQAREPGQRRWRRVVAEGFDAWHASDPGVSRYTYEKTVTNLAAPGAYRTVVRFRWLDAGGAVVERARARSRACRQPDLRPDLEVRRIDVSPGATEDSRRYAVTVRNRGRTAAGAFGVGLLVGERALEPLTLPALGPREERVVTFTGPACDAPATVLRATADHADVVAERDEDDNDLYGVCNP